MWMFVLPFFFHVPRRISAIPAWQQDWSLGIFRSLLCFDLDLETSSQVFMRKHAAILLAKTLQHPVQEPHLRNGFYLASGPL